MAFGTPWFERQLVTGGIAAVKRFYGAIQSLFFAPVQRWATYQINEQNPNVIADPSDLVSFYRQGFMTWDSVSQMLKYHGVDTHSPADYPYKHVLQNGVLTLQHEQFPAIEIKPGDVLRWESFLTPDLRVAIEMYFRGVISKQVFVHWCNREGIVDNEIINTMIDALSQVAQPSEALRNQLRQQLEENTGLGLRLMAEWDPNSPLAGYLRANGYRSIGITSDNGQLHTRDQAELWWENHWSMPSYDQAVTMFQRFRPNRLFRYAELFPNLKTLTAKDLNEFAKINDIAPGIRQEIAAAQFSNIGIRHVRLLTRFGVIDEAEAVEYLIDSGFLPIDARKLGNLYARQRDTQIPLSTELKQFHRGNLKEIDIRHSLEKRGYSDKQADLVIDESKPILSVYQLRSMARKNLVSSQEFIRLAERTGYSDGDIDLLYQDAMWHYRDKYTQLGINKIKQAYKVGYDNRASARALLLHLGITSQEADQALDEIDLELAIEVLQDGIREVRRMLFSGFINIELANQYLISLNVAFDRRQLYIRQWQVRLSQPRRQLSASEIVKAIRQGVINEAEGIRRLNNLGFDSGSIQYYLTQSALGASVDANRAIMQASRTVAERQKAAAAAVKAHDRQGRQLRADLSRHSSPAQLKRWLKLGLISDDEARVRLQDLAWPEDDADRLIEESHSAAAKTTKKASSAPATP